MAGLSLRGRGHGFPLASMTVAPGYFALKEIPSCFFPRILDFSRETHSQTASMLLELHCNNILGRKFFQFHHFNYYEIV